MSALEPEQACANQPEGEKGWSSALRDGDSITLDFFDVGLPCIHSTLWCHHPGCQRATHWLAGLLSFGGLMHLATARKAGEAAQGMLLLERGPFSIPSTLTRCRFPSVGPSPLFKPRLYQPVRECCCGFDWATKAALCMRGCHCRAEPTHDASTGRARETRP